MLRRGFEAAAMEELPRRKMKPRSHALLAALALVAFAGASPAQPPADVRGKAQVFAYEGEPEAMAVEKDAIVMDYEWSRVTVDRATLAVKSRVTRTEPFRSGDSIGMAMLRNEPEHINRGVPVGPGISDVWFANNQPKPSHVEVAAVTNGEVTWRAMQPSDALNAKYRDPEWTSWTKILQRVGAASYVERSASGQTNRFTQEQGLPGNLVTHLVVVGGVVWAGCVDIYNNETKTWTNGGLCFFDKRQGRWREAPAIENRQIRFVTGLQAIGDDLYVLHREGEGMTGDEIAYGMGLYPGDYRPVTTNIVLSRRDKDGKWTSWRRAPVVQAFGRPRYDFARLSATTNEPSTEEPSTERAETVAVDGTRLVVYSTVFDFGGGNWVVSRRGVVSVLDTVTGAWKVFDPVRDFDADALTGIHAENGEILVTSNVGVHRWRNPGWEFINTGAALKNSEISAVTSVGDEVWIGYNKPGFGVYGTQGISRYSEKTGQWSWMSPEDLGTASPVQQIVSVNGEAFVLFGAREWLGSAREWNFYPREEARKMPAGLGRFAGGKWEFPFVAEGIPATAPREYTNSSTGVPFIQQELVQVRHIAAVGGKLRIGTSDGFYEGPAPFKKIKESPPGFGDMFPWMNPEGIQLPGEEKRHQKGLWENREFNITVTPYADWLWGDGVLIRREHEANAASPSGPGARP
jgi:hypothetical protein